MNKHFALLVMLLALASCDSLPSWMGGSEKKIERLPGEREDVLKSSVDLKPDEILQNVTFKVPPANENADWAQHTGQFTAATANLAVKGDLTSIQNASAGEGNEFSHTLVPRPVVAGGKVFAMDAIGIISAHDAGDITNKLWSSHSLVNANEEEVMGGGLAVDGGVLYAVSGAGHVAAIDTAGGTELWKRDLGVPLRSAPRVADGKVFIITIDSQLFALNAKDGASLWSHRGIGETAGIMNSISPTIASDMVIVPYASGELYGLKMDTGDEVWRASLAQARRTEATAVFSGIGGDPVVDETAVFAVSSSGMFSVTNLLNGLPLWDTKIASINTPWVVGEYVYALTEENLLICMVKYDGRIRWTQQLRRYDDEDRKLRPIVWRGPVMENDKLLLISTYGEMIQVDGGTGAILSTESVAENISTAPVVAGGKVFAVSKDATLYSYQ